MLWECIFILGWFCTIAVLSLFKVCDVLDNISIIYVWVWVVGGTYMTYLYSRPF